MTIHRLPKLLAIFVLQCYLAGAICILCSTFGPIDPEMGYLAATVFYSVPTGFGIGYAFLSLTKKDNV